MLNHVDIGILHVGVNETIESQIPSELEMLLNINAFASYDEDELTVRESCRQI